MVLCMVLQNSRSKRKRANDLRQVSLLAAVPAILTVGPLIGFFAGKWADDRWGTEPYLMIAGVVLGFGGAGIEIGKLVKKSSAIEKEKEKDNEA